MKVEKHQSYVEREGISRFLHESLPRLWRSAATIATREEAVKTQLISGLSFLEQPDPARRETCARYLRKFTADPRVEAALRSSVENGEELTVVRLAAANSLAQSNIDLQFKPGLRLELARALSENRLYPEKFQQLAQKLLEQMKVLPEGALSDLVVAIMPLLKTTRSFVVSHLFREALQDFVLGDRNLSVDAMRTLLRLYSGTSNGFYVRTIVGDAFAIPMLGKMEPDTRKQLLREMVDRAFARKHLDDITDNETIAECIRNDLKEYLATFSEQQIFEAFRAHKSFCDIEKLLTLFPQIDQNSFALLLLKDSEENRYVIHTTESILTKLPQLDSARPEFAGTKVSDTLCAGWMGQLDSRKFSGDEFERLYDYVQRTEPDFWIRTLKYISRDTLVLLDQKIPGILDYYDQVKIPDKKLFAEFQEMRALENPVAPLLPYWVQNVRRDSEAEVSNVPLPSLSGMLWRTFRSAGHRN